MLRMQLAYNSSILGRSPGDTWVNQTKLKSIEVVLN